MAEGFFNKFKMMIGMGEEEDEEEEVMMEAEQTPAVQTRPQPVAVNSHRSFSYPDRSSSYTQPKVEHRESKVVSMQNNSTAARQQQFKLVVTEPASFDECPKLVDSLKSRKPLIINLANLDNETAHKIFNFLSGATYALNGNVQKVANNIFVFTPDNVDVLSSIETEQRSSGISIAASPWRR